MEYDGFEAYVKLKTRFARQTTAKAVLKMLEGGFEVKRTPELEESEAKWEVVKDLTKLDGGERRFRRR